MPLNTTYSNHGDKRLKMNIWIGIFSKPWEWSITLLHPKVLRRYG
jgi:hypothetical protein